MNATIRDVALASGLSTATVSRVLNGDASVAAATALRVRAEVERLGYTMNHVARSLKKGSTRTVGVIAPELASDFFMLLAESMDRELSGAGYSLIVCSSWESAEEEAERMRLLAERLVDGLVVIPATGSGELLRCARAAARDRPPRARRPPRPGPRGRRRPRRQRGRRLSGHSRPRRRRASPHRLHRRQPRAVHRPRALRGLAPRHVRPVASPSSPNIVSFAGLHVASGYRGAARDALAARRARRLFPRQRLRPRRRDQLPRLGRAGGGARATLPSRPSTRCPARRCCAFAATRSRSPSPRWASAPRGSSSRG